MTDQTESQKKRNKVYQKPMWVKEELVERFALACKKPGNKKAGACFCATNRKT
jgi:hypothetical protein